ncbi:MAG: phosphopantetheine-binding protein [Nitrososphaerota archaeon]|jgi:acyl carrier protein|nr:phosphopantetheine-binding protein [Nitrososphaerota archaeon]
MINKLQEIIRRYTDDENILIKEDMVLLTDLGLNSFELVEIICEVEEKFGVEIPDRVIGDFKTIQDLMDYISSHE